MQALQEAEAQPLEDQLRSVIQERDSHPARPPVGEGHRARTEQGKTQALEQQLQTLTDVQAQHSHLTQDLTQERDRAQGRAGSGSSLPCETTGSRERSVSSRERNATADDSNPHSRTTAAPTTVSGRLQSWLRPGTTGRNPTARKKQIWKKRCSSPSRSSRHFSSRLTRQYRLQRPFLLHPLPLPIKIPLFPLPPASPSKASVTDQSFVITGKLASLSSDRVRTLIEAAGGRINTHPQC